MISKKQKTVTKFYTYEGFGAGLVGSTITLVLGEPYEVTFFCTSKSGLTVGNNKIAILNQTIFLNGFDLPVGTNRLYPSQFTVKCNLNEIDVTNWQLQINAQLKVIVTARYYV